MRDLPRPGDVFLRKKTSILGQLSVPAAEYKDASPKGSVDAGIRLLIDEINAHPGLVTTSSCAGRVSVYLEGEKQKGKSGGKGGGGRWLFVSHDTVPVPVPVPDSEGQLFGLRPLEPAGLSNMHRSRLAHFKFEPMVSSFLSLSVCVCVCVCVCGCLCLLVVVSGLITNPVRDPACSYGFIGARTACDPGRHRGGVPRDRGRQPGRSTGSGRRRRWR